MQTICHTRFRGKAMTCDEVNIPAMTRMDEMTIERDGKVTSLVAWKGVPICKDTSQTYRDHFTRDDDGKGMERGRLTSGVIKALQIRKGETPEGRNKRWEPIWASPLCLKYKDTQIADHWIWSIDFYNAPLDDLRQIAKLAGYSGGERS